MEIIIKTKNVKLTQDLEKFINEKMGRLEKFLHDKNQEIFVEIEKESNHHKQGEIFCAEAILTVPGKKMVAAAKHEDLFSAITEVKEELEIEIKKHKTKMVETPRREAKKTSKENRAL